MNGGNSRRRTLGGRGREWAQSCYKLLEDMFELEDSKPFQNPVNELQFADYYTVVTKHMDLSKVRMNLHTGVYDSPVQFAEDIRLIVSNWKIYIKDKESQLNSQIHALSWYFEQEFTPIAKTWESVKPKRPRNSPSSFYKPNPPARQVRLAVPAIAATLPTLLPTPQVTLVQQPTPTSVGAATVRNGHAIVSSQSEKSQSDSPLTINVSTSSITSISSSSSRPTAATSSNTKLIDGSSMTVEMKIEVTNIWFGPCRIRPHRLLHFSEKGFKMFFMVDGKEIDFMIKASEIVRAMGHLSKSRKHTLFLFVTPSCDKRLRELAFTHKMFGAKPKGVPCSLYAIFIKSLLPMQISRLIHIFWNMSKTSIFSPVFSEVDQKGALSILANIKPQIMEKLAEKVTDLHSAAQPLLGTAKTVGMPPGISVNTFTVNVAENRASPIPNGPTTLGIAVPVAASEGSSSRPITPNSGMSAGESPVARTTGRKRKNSDDSDLEDLEIVIPAEEDDDDEDDEAETIPETDLLVTGSYVSTKCPITQSTMRCPMKNEICGHSYDREGVQQLIINRGDKARCPVPGCSNTKPLLMNQMSFDFEVIKLSLSNPMKPGVKSRMKM